MQEPARAGVAQHSSSRYRYCTNFAISGRDLDPGPWIGRLEALGDSVLVVGDAATLKIHVHTDEPEAAIALFAGAGELSHRDVADMREQVLARSDRLAAAVDQAIEESACGALAVVSGAGMAALYEGLGVSVLDGGPTLNPSTSELLAAIHEVPAKQVVVLPNSPNVVMAAEHAARLSEKVVRVSAVHAQQAGLSAALALDPQRSADDNAVAIDAALATLRTGAVAPAARADVDGRFGVGDAVGFVDDSIVAWGAPAATLGAVLAALADGDVELLTCVAGEGAPLDEAAIRELGPDGVELECELGGQPSYWWLVVAE